MQFSTRCIEFPGCIDLRLKITIKLYVIKKYTKYIAFSINVFTSCTTLSFIIFKKRVHNRLSFSWHWCKSMVAMHTLYRDIPRTFWRTLPASLGGREDSRWPFVCPCVIGQFHLVYCNLEPNPFGFRWGLIEPLLRDFVINSLFREQL